MKLDQWMDICGYMKKQMSMNIDNPNQLITKIVEVFEKKALRDDQDNFNISSINLRNFRGCFYEVKKQLQQE